jgi:hypothetical protein
VAVTIVQYRARPERADENQLLVEAVFRELHARAPGGLRYASFRLADGVSFVHVAETERSDGANPLTETPAFGEFLRDLGERLEDGPHPSAAQLVGEYGFSTEAPMRAVS